MSQNSRSSSRLSAKRPNKMLLQMPHDDTNKVCFDIAFIKVIRVCQSNSQIFYMFQITNAYASDLQDESQKPLNDESHCEVHHQYINILDLTQDDNSEAAILLDDNLIEPSHDGVFTEKTTRNQSSLVCGRGKTEKSFISF
ncbi:UNVERIFIED_CONTAM: hypothetical protein FKN15_049591 [Acipenser sinensis]